MSARVYSLILFSMLSLSIGIAPASTQIEMSGISGRFCFIEKTESTMPLSLERRIDKTPLHYDNGVPVYDAFINKIPRYFRSKCKSAAPKTHRRIYNLFSPNHVPFEAVVHISRYVARCLYQTNLVGEYKLGNNFLRKICGRFSPGISDRNRRDDVLSDLGASVYFGVGRPDPCAFRRLQSILRQNKSDIGYYRQHDGRPRENVMSGQIRNDRSKIFAYFVIAICAVFMFFSLGFLPLKAGGFVVTAIVWIATAWAIFHVIPTILGY